MDRINTHRQIDAARPGAITSGRPAAQEAAQPSASDWLSPAMAIWVAQDDTPLRLVRLERTKPRPTR
jgi:hypothetical protein